jgi:hypothetical protein
MDIKSRYLMQILKMSIFLCDKIMPEKVMTKRTLGTYNFLLKTVTFFLVGILSLRQVYICKIHINFQILCPYREF